MPPRLLASQNFDFIAFSFALSTFYGRIVDLERATAFMNDSNKRWFMARYKHFMEQLEKRDVTKTIISDIQSLTKSDL